MRLLLIRHGQSSNNHLEDQPDYHQQRQPDPALTELGHSQAAKLAEWATTDTLFGRITHLYTSLMTRAVQTASPLAQALRLNVHGLTEAYECGGLNSGPEQGFAAVAGRDHAALSVECPRLLWPNALQGQPWDGGCEPWTAEGFTARAARVIADLQGVAQEADVVALVTHHDFAQYLMANLLGLPALNGMSLTFRLNNTSTTYLGLDGAAGVDRQVLQWCNRTDHLSPELITF